MKKVISAILSAVFVLCSFSICTYAGVQSSDIAKTRLGTSDLYYEYTAVDKTLTISGQGDGPNYSLNGSGTPWYEWRDESIDRVVVEEGVTSLGNYMFNSVYATDFVLPHSLQKIGSYTFSNTANKTDWVLPFGLKTIGSYAFANCINMTSIIIPDTVTSIGSRAFQGCSALTSIEIPYSVSSIGTYAFYQCRGLTSVKFQSLTATVTIGNYCFMGCSSLANISIPKNATVNQYSVGYADKNTKYTLFSMNVYDNSSGYSYAVANGFSYNCLNSFSMENGVSYRDSFTEDNLSDSFCFAFTADASIEYNFYSLGECDTTAVLRDSIGNVIAQNDDVSNQNRNFMITASLLEGETYYLYVSSVRSLGEFTTIVYPNVVNSVDVFGELSLNANEGDYSGKNPHFNISDDMMSQFVLTIEFENGYSDMIYYYNGTFDNKNIGYVDNQSQSSYTCGVNKAEISIGSIAGQFDVNISHSYDAVIVPYTADDDGYTSHTCILCKDNYKDEFVATPAITISGVAYIQENKNSSNADNTPYNHFVIKVEDREYPVNEDGTWSFNTLNDCTALLENNYGENVEISVSFDSGSTNVGSVIMQGYDFNNDGKINGKDYAVYVKGMKNPYGMDYMKYFGKNLN